MKTIAITLLALAASTNAEVPCPVTYKVDEYDTCEKITFNFDIRERDLKNLNYDLNCKYLLPKGKEVCISREAPKPCKRIYKVREFDLCTQLQEVFNVSKEDLINWNTDFNCKRPLPFGKEVCVGQDEVKPCKEMYEAPGSMTLSCKEIKERFGIAVEELHGANNNLDCSRFKKICFGVEEPKPCTKNYRVNEYKNLYSIGDTFGVSFIHLTRLNTFLAFKGNWFSDALNLGTNICLSNEEPKIQCTNTYKVDEFNTCGKIEIKFGLNRSQLHILNNDLNCLKFLPKDKEICVSSYDSKNCHNFLHAGDKYNTCAEIEALSELTRAQMVKINPHLNCDEKIPQGTKICVWDNDKGK